MYRMFTIQQEDDTNKVGKELNKYLSKEAMLTTVHKKVFDITDEKNKNQQWTTSHQ